MSEINSPNISAQPASVDDHEWYYSENDKAPIAKKRECLQFFFSFLLVYHLLISLYFYAGNSSASQYSTDQQVAGESRETGKHFLLPVVTVVVFLKWKYLVGRGQRNKQISKFDEVLQQEKLDEWGNSESLKPPPSVPSRRRSSRKLKKSRTGASDEDDNNFDDSSSETESVESGDTSQISNNEVCDHSSMS
jgi:hypothetical protein